MPQQLIAFALLTVAVALASFAIVRGQRLIIDRLAQDNRALRAALGQRRA